MAGQVQIIFPPPRIFKQGKFPLKYDNFLELTALYFLEHMSNIENKMYDKIK